MRLTQCDNWSTLFNLSNHFGSRWPPQLIHHKSGSNANYTELKFGRSSSWESSLRHTPSLRKSFLSMTCWVSNTGSIYSYNKQVKSIFLLIFNAFLFCKCVNLISPSSLNACYCVETNMAGVLIKFNSFFFLQVWLWSDKTRCWECSYVWENMPRQGKGGEIWRSALQELLSTAAQQPGCGDSEKGMSSGQTNVLSVI